MTIDKSKLMVVVRETLEKEGVTQGGSIFRNVVDAVLKELGYDGQAQELIARYMAENSAQHQEIISLRRRVEQLERTIGKMSDTVEMACTPTLTYTTPWLEMGPASSQMTVRSLMDAVGTVIPLESLSVEDSIRPRPVDGVGVGAKLDGST